VNIISLFCGAGGLDLGFEQEGFCPVVAYDIESVAVETYNYNRNNKVAIQADLVSLSADDIISHIQKLGLDELPRGIVGGPPCQYFSVGNSNRKSDDPRRTLPMTYANLLQRFNQVHPLDFFVFENVAGLANAAHKQDFEQIIALFEQAGFSVFHTILDAYHFGVPQNRKRVFLAGWNKNLYPDAQYEFPIGEPSSLVIRDAIHDLVEPTYYKRGLNPDDFPEHPNHWTMQPISKKFTSLPPSDFRHSGRSFRRLSWERPSYTVAYGHNEIHIHPNGHRRLSIYEAMLLQGFPKGRNAYKLLGTLSDQVTLISDAVPPPLAQAVARSFINFINQYHNTF